MNVDTLAIEGREHRQQGRFEHACACFERALEIDPRSARAHGGLAATLEKLGRMNDAAQHYFEAVRFRPNNPAVWQALGGLLLAQGRVEAAISAFRKAVEQAPGDPEKHGDLLYALHYDTRQTAESIAHEHFLYGTRHGAAAPFRRHENSADPERKLRVAYVSSDFYHHPVARFFEPVLRHHNREEFQVALYSSSPRADAVTGVLRGLAEEFHDVSKLSDGEFEARLRADGNDVIVDLTAHTSVARLGALKNKPAPVQFSYIGYPDTTGLEAFDCRITDERADPTGAEVLYRERLTRIPQGFLCYEPPSALPAIGPPPSVEEGSITYGSFSKPSKWNGDVLETWCAILHRVPGSRLILHHSQSSVECAVDFLARFLAHGVEPTRIDIAGSMNDADHFGLYNRIDVMLDTFPYAGTTSTCEALWMGVPVVTLAGRHHACRTGVSLLHQAGKREWIAQDRERYVEIAIALANDVSSRAAWRNRARDVLRASPLCDGAGLARSIENAYRDCWRRWCMNRSNSART